MERRTRAERQRIKKKRKRKIAASRLTLLAVVLLCVFGIGLWLQGGSGNGDDSALMDEASSAPSPSISADDTPQPSPSEFPRLAASSDPLSSPSPDSASEATVAPSPASTPAMTVKPSDAGDTRLTMAFVGDVIFASGVETILKQNGFDYPYRELRDVLAKPDITAANLETPITTRGSQQVKEYTYRSLPEALKPFKEAGFDVVNLANNHIMDYGVDGLLDTLHYLDEEGIKRTGAGENVQEAYAPAIIEKNGIRVAFLGFSHKVPEESWKAGASRPGTTQLYDPAQAIETISETKKEADLVVVMAHWGEERQDTPLDKHRKMARDFIDAGADLVIGSHPHVLQGFETYKGKWIAYSLGNFLFTTNTFEPSWETIVLQIDYTDTGAFSLSAVPVRNTYAHPVPIDSANAKKLFKRLTSISYGVRVDEEGRIAAD